MNHWYFDPVGDYTLVVAAAVAMVLLMALVNVPRDRLSGGRRFVLIGLRMLLLLLTLVAMLRPVLIHTQSKKQSATLVLLVDCSRSMLVTDAFGGKTRWESLVAALTDALPHLKTLGQELEIKLYTFDEQLEPRQWKTDQLDLPEKPEGQQTAIGAALEDVLRREAGKRLVGVVLLSDGAQRAYAPRDVPPQTPARRMADLGFPLYAFAIGQARGQGQSRDVAVKDLVVNQTVFVKNQLDAAATVRVDGLTNQPVRVQLLFENPAREMEVVATEELRPTRDGASVPVALSYVPQTAGEYKLTLRAAQQPGEIVTTNNELSTFVTVLKGGLNVLYLEGAVRVEQKFLRRSLDASADIKLDYVRLDYRLAKQRQSDLLEKFQRGKYDVYIIGDLDSSVFKPEELQALAKVVEQGAGLLMLGGYHSFGPGGYGDTPLAHLLPIEMSDLDRQGFDEPIRTKLHLPGPLKMVPQKRLGTRHFVMSLAASDANAAAWAALPPLQGANKLGPLKPSAQVLAETPDGKPLLVAAEAGGRVMAFAGDSTWRWWMKGFEGDHRRFWRQIVLWLAHKDEQSEGNVWIKLAQRRVGPGGRVDFAAGAQIPHGEIARDATFEAAIVLPDGNRHELHLTRDGDQMIGTFNDTQLAGDYTLEVGARQEKQQLGSAAARFLVYEQDLELDNAASDPTLLASLAKTTEAAGGRLLAPEELPALVDEISRQPLELEVQNEVKETPWDSWPFFAAFVGLLSLEWYLRKKWGLV